MRQYSQGRTPKKNRKNNAEVRHPMTSEVYWSKSAKHIISEILEMFKALEDSIQMSQEGPAVFTRCMPLCFVS